MDEAGPLSSFIRGPKVDGHSCGRAQRSCYLCGSRENCGGGLCRSCRDDLPRLAPGRAAKSIRQASVDEWMLPFVYTFPLTTLVQRAKFRRDLAAMTACAALMGKEVSAYFPSIAEYEHILPVPLSFWRYVTRGFNQARFLARAVAHSAGREAAGDFVVRRGYQRPQSALDAAARQRNVAEIFVVRRRLDGDRVLIVDDVVTTGATVASLATALKAAGAARVGVIALAATP